MIVKRQGKGLVNGKALSWYKLLLPLLLLEACGFLLNDKDYFPLPCNSRAAVSECSFWQWWVVCTPPPAHLLWALLASEQLVQARVLMSASNRTTWGLDPTPCTSHRPSSARCPSAVMFSAPVFFSPFFKLTFNIILVSGVQYNDIT